MRKQNRHRSSSRRGVATLCLLLSISGCNDDEGRGDPVQGTEPTEGEPAAEDVASTEAPERRSIRGRLRTDTGELLGDRQVVVVDGEGERFDITTDEAGTFALDDIVTPYDLAVAPPSRGGGTITVFLGLRREDPLIDLFERDGPSARELHQRLRLGVRVPICPGRASPNEDPPDANEPPPCTLTIVTVSPSGSGSVTLPYSRGTFPLAMGDTPPDGCSTESVVAEVEHSWRGGPPEVVEAIDVHVLGACRPVAGGIATPRYAYSRAEQVSAAPGDDADLGMVDLLPVPVRAPLAVGARDAESALSTWTFTTEVALDFGGGSAGVLLATTQAASAEVITPAIPETALRVRVVADHPRGAEGGGFHRSAQAWSGVVPVGGALEADPVGIAVDIDPGPEIVRPAVDGILARRGLGFAWRAAGPVLATLAVVDTARGVRRFRVYTTETAVPLERLAELGLAGLDAGPHVLDLTTTPATTVDDVTSPDAEVKDRRFDRRRAGSAAYLRVPFEVVE
jgi:hypothetical protein